MTKKYRCLGDKQEYITGDFAIIPIRAEDRYDIMQWRNAQMYHLRQKEPLTEKQQDRYFQEVVDPLFDQEQPNQILFSYLEKDTCIGYGGLVHINWHDHNAEISFIMETSLEKEFFNFHWSTFLALIEEVAFTDLSFHKVYTYAFDLRPELFNVLSENDYLQEAELKQHSRFKSSYIDVLIHAKLNKNFKLIKASIDDMDITYQWATDPVVRKYAITQSEITYDEHRSWFQNKLRDEKCIFYIAENKAQKVGSFRMDIKEKAIGIISYLLDSDYHGKGLGRKLLIEGIKKAKKHPSINVLYGEVMEQNKPSIKLFESLGFQKIELKHGLAKYQLEVS